MATGYESKAGGDWSQALGFKSIALGNYSTAIGKNAYAEADNSFALGDGASSTNMDSYAFGAGAIASGKGSYAFGSVERDTLTFDALTNYTNASGNYSFAIGLGAESSGDLGIAIGSRSKATGGRSVAIGESAKAIGRASFAIKNAEASGDYSIAIGGFLTEAWGHSSVAIGNGYADFVQMRIYDTKASGINSVAIGNGASADGNYSTAIGRNVTSQASWSFVTGRFNALSGSTTSWISTDPLFVIGNGSGRTSRSNAMTVLKNGRVGLQSVTSPAYALDIPNIADNGSGRGRANAWHTYSDGRIKTNLTPLPYGLAEIIRLEPLAYFQHNSTDDDNGNAYGCW